MNLPISGFMNMPGVVNGDLSGCGLPCYWGFSYVFKLHMRFVDSGHGLWATFLL